MRVFSLCPCGRLPCALSRRRGTLAQKSRAQDAMLDVRQSSLVLLLLSLLVAADRNVTVSADVRPAMTGAKLTARRTSSA